MEDRSQLSQMLNMMIQPGFCVEEGRITRLNPAAQGLALEVGNQVGSMLATGREEYARFTEGCLYLQLDLGGQTRGAAVFAMEGCQVFLLDPQSENRELSAYALAARTLRLPMGNVMIAAEGIAQDAVASGDEGALERAGQLNRGLHQLMRLINNMSDALLYTDLSRQELRNLTGLFAEIFEKARTLLSQAGLNLRYEGPREDICALADAQQLERAVLNLLSNAARFTPSRGTISASLTRRGETLRLSICDDGSGISDDILPGIFHRYLRSPCLEDCRFGLGLGMVLVRTAALNHGGTVLIDQPEGCTRITMTMALRQSGSRLRSPVMDIDYAGGLDHALVELSQVLPDRIYEKEL